MIQWTFDLVNPARPVLKGTTTGGRVPQLLTLYSVLPTMRFITTEPMHRIRIRDVSNHNRKCVYETY